MLSNPVLKVSEHIPQAQSLPPCIFQGFMSVLFSMQWDYTCTVLIPISAKDSLYKANSVIHTVKPQYDNIAIPA